MQIVRNPRRAVRGDAINKLIVLLALGFIGMTAKNHLSKPNFDRKTTNQVLVEMGQPLARTQIPRPG